MTKLAWLFPVAMLPFMSLGAEVKKPVQESAETAAVQIRPSFDSAVSIPLPSGGIYMRRGIYGSLSGGSYRKRNEQSLYQWQGELGFFYSPWFSGGSAFKMIAGQPSDPVQEVKNRFYLFGRFHKSWSQISLYGGGQIGMEDLSLSIKPDSIADIRAPLRNINAGMGLEFGLGWKFSRYVGFTLGQHFDASFVGDDTTNFEGSLSFRTIPGLSLDLLTLIPSAKKNVKALYVFGETQFGQLILEDRSEKQDFTWMFGATVGF